MNVIPEIRASHAELTQWRRYLHRHPELAYEENLTAEFVAEKLAIWGLTVERGLAHTGVVGTLERGQGPSVGLRADMDALPIREDNDFEHRSRHDRKMHACGHDGHTTMLLGAARYLSERGRFEGKVHFIFQPAEEAAGGAKLMMEEGLFDRYPVDAVFGMHNWPGLAVGRFAMRAGPLMASMDCFDVEIRGRGAHGALPHQGTDVIVAAAQLISCLQTLISRNVSPLDSAALSVTRIQAGDSHNVLPDTALLSGAVRCLDATLRKTLKRRFEEIVHGICGGLGVAATVQFGPEFPAVVNWEAPTALATDVTCALVGNGNVDRDTAPVMVSEDFSFMLERVPGCFIFIGNGVDQGARGLHSARYDFNDEILPLGASYLARIAERSLASGVS